MVAALRSHFAQEAAAGFPRLSRIPCTAIVRFLDYFETLDAQERDALLDALAQRAALRFRPPHEFAAAHEELRTRNVAFFRFAAAMQSAEFSVGLRYQDVKMTKLILGDTESLAAAAQYRSTLDWKPRDDLSATLVPVRDIHNLHPAKAAQLRKLVADDFKTLFGALQTAKLTGGETRYNGTVGSTRLTVSIDYGSRMAQLRYRVSMPSLPLGVSYEDLWVTSPGWDYLTEENAGESIALLCRSIAYLAGLPGAQQHPLVGRSTSL